jgi:threonine aldolase
VHEGGAIEYSGHKVITIPSKEGKVSASDVETYMHNSSNSDLEYKVPYSVG